jgi:hypothetical protein
VPTPTTAARLRMAFVSVKRWRSRGVFSFSMVKSSEYDALFFQSVKRRGHDEARRNELGVLCAPLYHPFRWARERTGENFDRTFF